MKSAKKASSPSKKYPPGSFMYKVRKQRIIETLAAFIGGGWLILEFVHWILIDHYHFPEESLDITFVTLICALLCTLTWRWFGGTRKRRKIKLEIVLIPAFILIAVFLDIRFAIQMGKHKEEHVSEVKWKNSIAVLPFANISGEEGQEYFCDGLTEELINKLSNIRELKVAARTSAFSFKGEKVVVNEVGRKLHVDKVLEGSVRKSHNQLRVTAQLINVSDGYHIWSQQYDRKLEDVFAIQDEISMAIVDKLKLELLGDEKGKLMRRHSENVEAHDLYLLGRFFWNKRTEEDMEKSIEYFEQAIEKDTKYALAYTGLADAYLTLYGWNVLPPLEALPKAKTATTEALAIDITLAEAHTSLATIKECYEWDWLGAEEEFKHAIELNSNYVTAHYWYAQFLEEMGRFDEAITEIERAQEIDPLSLITGYLKGDIFYSMGDYDRAKEHCQKMLEMYPNFNPVHSLLGEIYLQKGMCEEALSEFKVEDLLFAIGITYAKMNKITEARQVLEKLIEQSKHSYIPKSEIGLLYFALGEDDYGFEWLEKAYKERDGRLTAIKVNPLFDCVRSDPRFNSMLKRMNLE